jgi:GT2 family glycosyltransferase
LASIYSACWRDEFEVIVVDNHSHDGSVEMIRAKYPHVKLIANEDNKLFAIANNQGAKVARGEYLLLLNSDTLVYDDNLQRMMDYFSTLPSNVICVGPKILNPDKSVQSYGAVTYRPVEHFICLMGFHKRLPFLRYIWKRLPTSPNITHEVEWVSGACMMIPRAKYVEVGGLNENLEFYGEEPEFGYRTSKRGYKTMYYSQAEIIHLGGVSTKTNKKTERKEDDLRRYEKIVCCTNGYQGAIAMSHRTIIANRIKMMLSPAHREVFSENIEHERQVISYLKVKLKQSQSGK